MQALAVTPKKRNSFRIADVKTPSPEADEVLVKTVRVGICGTDLEIVQGYYGESPEGADYLILGHESLGHIEAVGRDARGFTPGDYVVATVRRPDSCINCQRGEPDMCLTGEYKERGIKGLHGFMSEYFVEKPQYLVKVTADIQGVAVLMEPLSIVEKVLRQAFKIQERLVWEPKNALVLGAGPIGLLATALLCLKGLRTFTLATGPRGNYKAQLAEVMGATYVDVNENPIQQIPRKIGNIDIIFEATGSSFVAFQAMGILGNNGIICLTSVSSGEKHLEVPSDALNLSMVLGNKVSFGSVNASKIDWERGIEHMKEMEKRWPGLLAKMITRRFPLGDFAQALGRRRDDIKVVIEL
ncbi:MAG: glucose 1-dehydrogenase [Chloroflexi bacterium]|nr:glucose 1-dehydrogenase [Chloroflexota bacterium]